MKVHLYKCLGCSDEWAHYRMPAKCDLCGHDELIRLDGTIEVTKRPNKVLQRTLRGKGSAKSVKLSHSRR